MTGSAAVRSIDEPLRVEQVAHDVHRAVRAGRIGPGTEFSVREIAQRSGVRPTVLRELLDSTAHDALFTLRGDTGVVAPLDLRVVRSLHQLRMDLQVALVARSCSLITPELLDQLEPTAFSPPMGVDLGGDALFDARRDFWLTLCAPSATRWDLRTLKLVWDGCERYYRIGIDTVSDGAAPGPARRQALMNDILDQYREFMDRCRSRDADAVASSVRRNSTWAGVLAEESLTNTA